ncbi:MAG TPA: alpha/beta hydrolase [Rheinheimera sp.]|nr:alpha/beta hydrolase [Rheinheimera sp.]
MHTAVLRFPLTVKSASTELAALSNQQTLTQQPILCLHGWLDNAASFSPLAPFLGTEQLLALEFPGHGHSPHRSSDAHYYFFDWVQDLVALCQAQQWQNLRIIGHSMGGMVATALAAAFPELVSRLILIDSLGFITDNADNAAKQLRDGINSRLKTVSRTPRYATLQEAAAARQRQSDFDMTQALLLAERGTEPTKQGFQWRADLRLRHSSVYRMTEQQAVALMSAVACPVLAIMASDSAFANKAKHYCAYYSRLQLEKVTGGHHCHMTNPADVAKHIKRFL